MTHCILTQKVIQTDESLQNSDKSRSSSDDNLFTIDDSRFIKDESLATRDDIFYLGMTRDDILPTRNKSLLTEAPFERLYSIMMESFHL